MIDLAYATMNLYTVIPLLRSIPAFVFCNLTIAALIVFSTATLTEPQSSDVLIRRLRMNDRQFGPVYGIPEQSFSENASRGIFLVIKTAFATCKDAQNRSKFTLRLQVCVFDCRKRDCDLTGE